MSQAVLELPNLYREPGRSARDKTYRELSRIIGEVGSSEIGLVELVRRMADSGISSQRVIEMVDQMVDEGVLLVTNSYRIRKNH